jgi:hypothetical protein
MQESESMAEDFRQSLAKAPFLLGFLTVSTVVLAVLPLAYWKYFSNNGQTSASPASLVTLFCLSGVASFVSFCYLAKIISAFRTHWLVAAFCAYCCLLNVAAWLALRLVQDARVLVCFYLAALTGLIFLWFGRSHRS